MAEQPPHIYTRHRNQLLQEQHNQGFTMLASWSIVVHFVNLLHDNFVPNYPIEWDIDCLLLPIPFLLRFSGKGTGAATPWGYNSLGDLFFTLKSAKMDWKRPKRMTSHALAPFYLSGVQFGALLRPWKTHFQGWSLKKCERSWASQSWSWRPVWSRKKTKIPF